MAKAKYIVTAVALLLSVGTLFALNEQGNYTLAQEGRAIQRIGAPNPFFGVEMLPDTAPPYFPHPEGLKFKNRKFHLLTQAPGKDLLAFSSGEGNEWIGFLDLKERYMKFLGWGVMTQYLDLTFSPDGKYLAYAFHGPDHRTMAVIIPTPDKETAKPQATNTWFQTYRNGEKFVPVGWVLPGDTIYSFTVVDSSGTVLESVDLPLHIDWDNVPENMMRQLKKVPAGQVEE